MKRTYIFIIMLLFLCLSGCADIISPTVIEEVNIASIPSEVVIGDFDGAGIHLELLWSDSSTTLVPVKESSLPESEKAKLNTPGITTITYFYEGIEVSFDIKLVVHSTNTAEKYHDYVVTYEVLPNCIENGYQDLLCDCGVVGNRTLPALGHDLGEEEVITEATCTDDGLIQQPCLREGCDHVESTTVKKISHQASDWIVDTEPDCTTKGKRHTECVMCHQVMSNQDINAVGHEYSDWVITLEATCLSKGSQERYCLKEECRFIETKDIAIKKHTQGVEYVFIAATCISRGESRINCVDCDGVLKQIETPVIAHIDENNDHYCDFCNELLFSDAPYYLADEQKYVFGMYPQQQVKDSSLIESLTKLAGTLPNVNNFGSWVGYGYNDLSKKEQMWYKDIVLDNFKYRAIYFISYRAMHTDEVQSATNSFQDDNGYRTETIYFFKYTPIKWRLLNQDGNKYTIMSDIAIDTLEFNDTTIAHSNEDKIYANNYEYSSIREFLNNEFYNTAFSADAENYIANSLVVNSSDNIYSSNDTNDKVYILSSAEYGMYYKTKFNDINASDYAKALGCEVKNSCSLVLRSPYLENSTGSMYVDTNGRVLFDYVNRSSLGVVPVITIVIE